MSSSVTLTNAFLSSLADRIVEARRLHGADSAYVIGLISGVNWLLESEGSSGELRRQFADQILESETGASSNASSTSEPKANGDSSTLAENSWIKGAVKWFNNDKGYGFISTDSDTDVFVHWRDISSWDRSLVQGDQVEFMVTKTAKGFQAVNVMKSETGEDAAGQPDAGEPDAGVADEQSHGATVEGGQAIDEDAGAEAGTTAPAVVAEGESSSVGDHGADADQGESGPNAPEKEVENDDSGSGTGFGVISSDNDDTRHRHHNPSRTEQSHDQGTDPAQNRFVAESGEV